MARLRVDVYSAASAKQNFGPLFPLTARYSHVLDAIGTFEYVFSAEDEKVTNLAIGEQVWLYHEGEGLCFKGSVSSRRIHVDESGQQHMVVSGLSIARELVWANTLLGRNYQGDTVEQVADDLLSLSASPYTWTSDDIDVLTSVDLRYNGSSVWAALRYLANYNGLHLREDNINRQIDIGVFGTQRAINLQNIEQVNPLMADNSSVFPISGIEIVAEESDLWNKVIPLGGGEGINQLTLEFSTGTPLSNAFRPGQSAPDGVRYWFIRDATSVAAYGERTTVRKWERIYPLTNDDTGHLNAANALHRAANYWLNQHKDPLTEYSVSAVGLKHYPLGGGAALLEVGDKIRVRYAGIAWDRSSTGATVKRVWVTVNQYLWLLGFERSWDSSGADTWRLDVSTVDRQPQTDTLIIGDVVDDVQGMRLSDTLFNYVRESGHNEVTYAAIAGGNSIWAVEYFTYDSMLHQVTFEAEISTAGTPNFTIATNDGGGWIDRTAFFSGPFNAGVFSFDMTLFFQGNYGQPQRGVNAVRFTNSLGVAATIKAYFKSLVTTTTLEEI